MSKFHLYFLPANEYYDADDWVVHSEVTDDFQILGSIHPTEENIRQDCYRATQVISSDLVSSIDRWCKFTSTDEVEEKPRLMLVDATVDEIINFINTYNLVSN
ncbi:hypothetical protein [Vibrio phage PJN101]|nr:hypothetical protein [Vibrio phage PJN101]